MVLFSKLSPPWRAKYCGITHCMYQYAKQIVVEEEEEPEDMLLS